MKNIQEFINEDKKPKYVISYYVEGVGNDFIFTNNWESETKQEPLSKAEWWVVSDNNKWNFSEPDACVAWHGEKSFWGTIVKNSEDPENAPKYSTILKGRNLEKVKKCEK